MELLGDRSVRLAATLAVAIAIPVAGLFYFQFRSISALSQSSAVVLRQLSQETANGITQSLQDALKAPYINVLLRVSQAQTEPLDLSLIAPTLDEGLNAQPFVDRYYVWSDMTVEHRDAGPTGFPPLTVTVVDAGGRVVYPYGGPPPTRYVDERTFALVFFDPELQRFIAPEGHKPEMWRLRTGYDNQTIPDIVAARERPQRA